MIDIQQLTSLISAFRVETEKESISPETVGSILQAIADLLATATSETEYNIICFWKETLQQYRFLYDIQQRNIDDHSNVILSLMARSMADGATSSLTLAIGPATRTRDGVISVEDYILFNGAGMMTFRLMKNELGHTMSRCFFVKQPLALSHAHVNYTKMQSDPSKIGCIEDGDDDQVCLEIYECKKTPRKPNTWFAGSLDWKPYPNRVQPFFICSRCVSR